MSDDSATYKLSDLECKDSIVTVKPPSEGPAAGGRRGLKAKTLRRMLKKAGLKVSGKKSTLTKRAKKAHLVRGGGTPSVSALPADRAGSASFGTNMSGGDYSAFTPSVVGAPVGGRRHGVKAKTLKKLLKRAGLKVSGKKATLRARAKKAHLVRGGV
jgi:hypothetical protein